MAKLTSADFDPRILNLFDRYVHGFIDRRDFLRAARTVVGAAGAELALEQLLPNFALAEQVAANDVRIAAARVEFASPKGYGQVRGYLVRPVDTRGKRPTVLVVHENRGLNPYIEDVARRLALEGFIALAPDALAPLGGYPGDEDKARALFQTLDQDKTHADFLAAAAHLQDLPGSNGRLGAIGFCYGGGVVNYLASRVPELAAGVPFYGGAPAVDDVPKIRAALQLHFAGADDRVNATWPPYEEALKRARVDYRAFVYPGAQHGFHNDTTPRFDQAAAALAWQRSIDFLREHLRT